ncbi:MAG: hypothetical protein Q8K79_16330 [Solirubrobacteraceae bacterium]|nr:hypothetical protein [Solirubrobacteraceae bacterium]
MSAGAPAAPPDRLAELRASAKGWHGIQLAALGFIGLCGVIQTGDATDPWTLQVLSAILVLAAFCLACAGIYLVGRAAWPLYRGEPGRAGDDAAAIELVSRQLTRGLLMTFLSIAALALATAASWWPKEAADAGAGGSVRVQTDDGRTACGELTGSPQPGTLRVETDAQPVVLSLDALASVAPVSGC